MNTEQLKALHVGGGGNEGLVCANQSNIFFDLVLNSIR
jgi:hypothetical protein